MFWIDNATAAAEAPAAPAEGSPGHFTGGDPAQQVPATVVDAWWLEQVQEELLGVLAAAGVVPIKGDNRQLALSIRRLAPPASIAAADASAWSRQGV